MKIILSPAKSLNYEVEIPAIFSTPFFEKEIIDISNILRKKTPKDLSDLMGISDKLASLNWERNQNFSISFTSQNTKQAVFVFNGDAYLGLDVLTLSKEELDKLQDRLRILSGLYGILKPLDLIKPYRLEMGTKLKIGTKENLYKFWKEKLSEYLKKDMQYDTILVNLASKEYASVIDFTELKDKTIITPQFKSLKNGKLKIISFYAKKARGMMTRFIVKNNINSSEELLSFNEGGYRYSDMFTQKEEEPVFIMD